MVAEALVRRPPVGQTVGDPAMAWIGEQLSVVWLEGSADLPREERLLGGFSDPITILEAASGRTNPTLTATVGTGSGAECLVAWVGSGEDEGAAGVVHIWGRFLSGNLAALTDPIQITPRGHGAAYGDGGSSLHRKNYSVTFEPRTQTLLVAWIGYRDGERTLGWRTINAVTHDLGEPRMATAPSNPDANFGKGAWWVDVAAADGPEYLLGGRAEAFFLTYVRDLGEHIPGKQVSAIAIDADGHPLWEFEYDAAMTEGGPLTYLYVLPVAGEPAHDGLPEDRRDGGANYSQVATAYDPLHNHILVVYWRGTEDGFGPQYMLCGRFVPGSGLLVIDRQWQEFILPGTELDLGVRVSESQLVEDGRLMLVYSKRRRRYTLAYLAKGGPDPSDVDLYAMEIESAGPGAASPPVLIGPVRLARHVRSFDLKVHTSGSKFANVIELGGRVYGRAGGSKRQSDLFHVVTEERPAADLSGGGVIKEYLWTTLPWLRLMPLPEFEL